MSTDESTDAMTLRLNQGDASERRIYYLAHFVAESLGLFANEGLTVVFQTSETGGATVRGGQIPAVLSGAADLTVGGPMVAMKMLQDGEARLVSFCAVAAGNPWVLAKRSGSAATLKAIADLKGKRVIDIANVGTATLAFRWLLQKAGLSEDDVTLVPGSGDHDADVAKVAAGEADYALHSLHALAPDIAERRLNVAADLSRATGGVPWSAYIARPERIAAMRPAFEAFTRAIAKAQRWIAEQPVQEIANLISRHYPDHSTAALAVGIEGYRASGVIADAPAISRADFERFSGLLVDVDWLDRDAPFADLVDNSLAEAAMRGDVSSFAGSGGTR